MLLAGLPVPDRLVLDLARSLRALGIDGTAQTLEDAHAAGRKLVTLTIVDREAILRALTDCPYGLTELPSRPAPRAQVESDLGPGHARCARWLICRPYTSSFRLSPHVSIGNHSPPRISSRPDSSFASRHARISVGVTRRYT